MLLLTYEVSPTCGDGLEFTVTHWKTSVENDISRPGPDGQRVLLHTGTYSANPNVRYLTYSICGHLPFYLMIFHILHNL